MMRPNLPVSCLLLSFVALVDSALIAKEILLPRGEKSTWKYLDAGSAAAEWASPKFDDSKWKAGKSPLGYGERDLKTTVGYGDDANVKHITTYFRTTFSVEQKSLEAFEKIGIQIRRDDGAIVYVNGKEAARSNMPKGKVSERTLSAAQLGGSAETEFANHLIDVDMLKAGENTIAVEVHQGAASSSDLYLDVEIIGLGKGELPKRDYFREGIAALSQRDFAKATELFDQVDPAHPQYAEMMVYVGYQVYLQRLGRPQEGLALVKKGYDAAPANKNIVRAYIKAHVSSGVLFKAADIERVRKTKVAKEHEFLVSAPDLKDESRKLTRRELEADLDELEHILVNCFAYLELRDVDYRGALDAIRLSLGDENPVNSFELKIAKLISLFCDGHAGVMDHPAQFLPTGYAPFSAHSHSGRIYLCDSANSDFLDGDYPYVVSIDGQPIEKWLEVAGHIVVKESKQWHLRRSLDNLAYVNYIRAELGLPQKKEIALQLQSEDRKRSKEMEVAVQSRMRRAAEFPMGESRLIDNVGYLRIAQMTSSKSFLAEMEQWMAKFRDTDGLILDVRGNGGGTKSILFTLFPYFMKPDAPMRVVELSTYRMPMKLPKPNPAGFMMSNMSAQPITSERWTTDEQRSQVQKFLEGFKPEWALPMSKFSEWHVLALDASINPNAYYYDKPLIVLHDSGSFSAADIFVGAFEDHPNTTLMGEATGGGNGWMDRYLLPNSKVGVVLCQSAKFRANGKPYDGLGIDPDVKLEATPDDILGRGDSVLDAAVKRLQKSSKKK
ncbi:MAG: C-terminal processing protease CtpA/Prc [Pirellulaceae bacterium]|jgi:C-terminal processing protease CtpA/Prc